MRSEAEPGALRTNGLNRSEQAGTLYPSPPQYPGLSLPHQVLEKFQQFHLSLLFSPHLVAKIYSQECACKRAYTHTDLIITTSQMKRKKRKQRLKQVTAFVQGPQAQRERRLHSMTVKYGLQPPAQKVL